MLVEAYGGNSLSRAQWNRWFEKFQNGDFDKRQHNVIFLDDNAPNHRAKPTKDIVKALDWEPLAHAAYLPDLVPSDYHLFASLGRALADQRFTSYENVKSWLDDWLASKDRSFFGVDPLYIMSKELTISLRLAGKFRFSSAVRGRYDGRSHPPQFNTSREDRQIVHMAVTDRSVTSRTMAQHIESVTHHSMSARTIRRRLQQSGLSARHPLYAEPQTSPPTMVR
ncbi:mariner Mos1 transposase [Trichonephila clavipes]|nr:mariner Mos1 transposase [Trichonephila clavipes]